MKIVKKISFISLVWVASTYAAEVPKVQDRSALETAMKDSKMSGQIRYYYMSEDNKEGLRDYFGSAIGGKFKFETAPIAGIKAGIAFHTSQFLSTNFNTTSTESTASDKNSRYVAGLMDATDPSVTHLTGIGELYLNYKLSKTTATLGRMKLNTPFINPQDGRMIPTLEQGVWIISEEIEDMTLQGGFIGSFWVRSTSQWSSVADSLGMYPQGNVPLNPGEAPVASAYKGHTTSDGIYVASLAYRGIKGMTLQAWDYYVDNIMNVAYAQADYRDKFGAIDFSVAGQYIHEMEVGDGGNSDDTHPEYSYIAKDEQSHTFGGKIAVGYASTMLTLAATKVTDKGRFLFPREWGKEPLFTFQKRDRTDGSGDATSTLVTLGQDFKVVGLKGLTMLAGLGKYDKVDAKNWVLNKYATPSYVQGNLDFNYVFSGTLKGLHVEYLFVRKYATGNTYNNANFIFRKNDMNIHNLIVNYNF
jgi:hypothetical protein